MYTDEFEEIIKQNLNEKTEKVIVKLEDCRKCRFYDDPWIWGRTLHCCSQDSDNVRTSRNLNDLFKDCPLGQEIELTKYYIKQYGVLHRKPSEYDKGSILIVDFSETRFESDGYNPNVGWSPVVAFYYADEDEKDTMMELALDYYNRFNLNAEYVPKRYYG